MSLLDKIAEKARSTKGAMRYPALVLSGLTDYFAGTDEEMTAHDSALQEDVEEGNSTKADYLLYGGSMATGILAEAYALGMAVHHNNLKVIYVVGADIVPRAFNSVLSMQEARKGIDKDRPIMGLIGIARTLGYKLADRLKRSEDEPEPELEPEIAHLASDIVILSTIDERLHVLLAKRAFEPEKGKWTVPGGHVDKGERFYETAVRELEEETGISGVELHRLDAFDRPDRDPRYRIITMAYACMIDSAEFNLSATREATEFNWFPVDELPEMGFDHDEILEKAIEWASCNIRETAPESEPGPTVDSEPL